jgi:hypothetical protein
MRRAITFLAAALAALLLAAGSALAATTPTVTVPTSSTTPTPTTTKPQPMAVKGSVRLYLPDAFVVHQKAVTVPGRALHVAGYVRPFVGGQWVSVKSFIGHRLFKSDRLRVKPTKNPDIGAFTEALRSPKAGIVRVQVTHAKTPQMSGFYGARAVAALDPSVSFGSTGLLVQLIQQRLEALHFYMPQSGVYDQQTGLAVDAYHRLLRRGVSQTLDPGTLGSLLNGQGAFPVRYPHDGTHVEGNLGLQLLALINGSQVYRIYPISSGKPSTPTILGHFRVYSRVPGYLPDGMYYSDFFYSGFAIHGYDPAPDYPASHGCMRLPISDAISVFNWLNYGDVVDVYY